MPSRSTAHPSPPDPLKLRRESPGRYATGDGRFTVEQSSGAWILLDSEQADELGLPLVRGPFATLEDARQGMDAARRSPTPVSSLPDRSAALPKRPPGRVSAPPPARLEPPPIELREYRSADAEALRVLWAAVGFRSLGDDDASLRVFTQRNPGTFLVAVQGSTVVGTAMGAWDGRRGWIYHVATAPEHRRSGLGRRLVRAVEGRLQALGARKINVVVRDGNADGAAFWEALDYRPAPSGLRGRTLDNSADPTT